MNRMTDTLILEKLSICAGYSIIPLEDSTWKTTVPNGKDTHEPKWPGSLNL